MSSIAPLSWFCSRFSSSHFGGRSAALAGVVFVFSLGACSETPADGQCEKFLDHVIELEVNAGTASPDDKIAHKKALKAKKVEDKFITQCEAKIKSSQLECALKAKTIEEIDKCDN